MKKTSDIIVDIGTLKTKDDYLLNYKLYINPNATCIALGIHGGSFHDGDETWNKSQSQDFANKGVNIMQLNFRQTTTERAISDLTDACYFLQKMYTDLPFGVIGTSSGGFFSLILSTNPPLNIKISFAIHICPVSNPYQRFCYLKNSNHKYKNLLMNNQLLHFGSERNMRVKQQMVSLRLLDDVYTLVICGNKDVNVPEHINKHLFSNKNITNVMLDGGHEICYKKDKRVTNEIIKFLNQYIQ